MSTPSLGGIVRIAELSRRSGVPVATIKYYIREGLLPPGERTAPNQARYGERHLERLDLIRALREVAGLSILALGRVFAAMEDHGRRERPAYLAIALRALSEPDAAAGDASEARARARAEVDRLLEDLGWNVDPDSPGRDDLERALVGVHRFMPGLIRDPDDLRGHAQVMRSLADVEIPDDYDPGADRDAALRYAVLGTVLFEPIVLALRKLAHVDRVRGLQDRARAG